MRGLAVLLILCCAAAHAAPAKKKRSKRRRERPAATKKVEAPPEKPADDWDLRYALSLGAGGFVGGGANRGPAVGVTFTATPAFSSRRFSLDLDLNWRMATFRADVPDYGALDSTLHALPLLVAARVRVFQAGDVTVDVRGGLGPLLLFHRIDSDFGVASTRSALGWEAFVAGQGRVPVGPVELFAEVRFGLGEAHVPFVLGRATGAQALVGARYRL